MRDYLSRYPSEYALNVVDGKGFWGMVGASQKRGIYITSSHQPCSACTAKLPTIVVIVKRSQCKMYPHLHSASAVVRGTFVDFCYVLRMSLSHASSIPLHEPAPRLRGKGKVGCGYIASSTGEKIYSRHVLLAEEHANTALNKFVIQCGVNAAYSRNFDIDGNESSPRGWSTLTVAVSGMRPEAEAADCVQVPSSSAVAPMLYRIKHW